MPTTLPTTPSSGVSWLASGRAPPHASLLENGLSSPPPHAETFTLHPPPFEISFPEAVLYLSAAIPPAWPDPAWAGVTRGRGEGAAIGRQGLPAKLTGVLSTSTQPLCDTSGEAADESSRGQPSRAARGAGVPWGRTIPPCNKVRSWREPT